ncbi:nickel-dependent lactate racemase [bacterium]|nr:nickel-dependent lactate racemase [bacterium]
MQLAYGDSQLEFPLPIGVEWQTLDRSPADDWPAASLSAAVEDLISQLSARQLQNRSRLLLIIPDHTRRCRVHDILGALLPALEQRFQPQIDILIANGSHVLQPESTIRALVGADLYDAYPVQQHDSRNAAALDYWGMTSNGTPIYLNEKVKRADFILTIGGVLFHYFAGFGGGPKMLLPGVAGYETVRINHRRTVDEITASMHSGCREGHLDGNPVFLDLVEVVPLLPNTLSLQVVLNRRQEFIFCEAGPLLEVHRRACACVRAVYSIPIKRKADVVAASAGGFPGDVNLIQAHKSLHHAFQAVRDGGSIVLLAQCREGVGSSTCMPYFDAGDSAAMGKRLLEEYQINGQTALAIRMKAEKAFVYLVSALDPVLVARTGMIPVDSLEQAWEKIAPGLNRNAFGYLMPKASTYLPVVIE